MDGKGKTQPLDVFYKSGQFAEKDKVDAMLKDIDAKQAHINDMLEDKELVEEQLATFGSIHNIYVRVFQNNYLQKTFKEVQEEVKLEIKRHIRDKN